MIKPPFVAKYGVSGVWIEDSTGLTVADMSHLVEPGESFRVAELLANGTNEYLRRAEHARKIGREGGGRPLSKKPSPVALAKRKSRAKIKDKQQKPE